eukprot:CAMPEP_0203862706 /NCGR_PEP_ID=MMETSP0359-20131031/13750_1 /ASSEMBLY_ACC=CAM_ASM_000338 /TAXON_ID=268821 /ORGANISM="Scrippsiella Hangoei, Strain SHTV-5" /LENGTH=74 /DNA_ID=CAMNT_0050780145 /DNA_START=165 /DNA_END=387 /DNA_ORIENTATION=-
MYMLQSYYTARPNYEALDAEVLAALSGGKTTSSGLRFVIPAGRSFARCIDLDPPYEACEVGLQQVALTQPIAFN